MKKILLLVLVPLMAAVLMPMYSRLPSEVAGNMKEGLKIGFLCWATGESVMDWQRVRITPNEAQNLLAKLVKYSQGDIRF